MSAGFTMILLEVHYESYVNKCGRRRTDAMPFRNWQNSYTNHFRDNMVFVFLSDEGMTQR